MFFDELCLPSFSQMLKEAKKKAKRKAKKKAKRKAKLKDGWRSMSEAPMDGTVILITESAGSVFNVLPGAYFNWLGGEPLSHKGPGSPGWWGVCPSRYTGEGGDSPLPVRWKPLAIMPVCWKPMPEIESEKVLEARCAELWPND